MTSLGVNEGIDEDSVGVVSDVRVGSDGSELNTGGGMIGSGSSVLVVVTKLSNSGSVGVFSIVSGVGSEDDRLSGVDLESTQDDIINIATDENRMDLNIASPLLPRGGPIADTRMNDAPYTHIATLL